MRKLHFFPGLVLETELQPDGYYSCFEHDEYDLGCLVTHGKSREEAIEYYADALDEREIDGHDGEPSLWVKVEPVTLSDLEQIEDEMREAA